jgi:D-beta-D-heptose 7-phosphate kinase / D-beta-D-heptose 1-phosphate adenosyltransferase
MRPLVVIGDALLDIDAVGQAKRLSPDAPVPVLEGIDERPRAGGAALAATLAASGDRPVVLIAPLAADGDARRLRKLIDVELIAVPWSGSTPVKTRLRAGGQTVARVDRGGRAGPIGDLPLPARRALDAAAGVLVADYGHGAARLLRSVSRAPLVWDPHPRGSTPVPGAALVTPNSAEAAGFVPEIAGDGLAAARRRAATLARRWRAQAVSITSGAEGALLHLGAEQVLAVPPPLVAVGDSCGAGDCFAASATAALADGALPSEAVVAAVAAASRFVAAGGAGELSSRAVEPDTDVIAAVRAAGGRVVATGGCFDLLHAGHVALLQAARALGDCLVVLVNSDASVRRLKGPGRPLQPAADRARVLASLRYVDAVIAFEEDTPEQALRKVRPDLWVKGGDYDVSQLPERTVLIEWGGEAVVVPYLDGRSTSGLVESARR